MLPGVTTTNPRTRRRTGIHPAWWVAAVAFLTLLGAAGFRAAPSVLMVPLEEEFGWPRTAMSAAVSINLILYGTMAPFAAALMDRFGVRRVATIALLLIAAGSGLTVFVTASWQLLLTWGLLIGIGTGSMAMVFAATIANRWFVAKRGLVMGILTAAGATGQLIFLPVLAHAATHLGWRYASLIVAAAALAVIPFVLLVMRDHPSDLGVHPYGSGPLAMDEITPEPDPARQTGAARRAVGRSGPRRGPGRSGRWPAASRSAVRRRTGWSARTSSRPPMTTECPRRPPPGCWPWSASSTSPAPSSPAR